MRNIFRVAFVFIISLLILCVGTASAELVIDQNYQFVSSIRVGRTAYDYTYQVNITNNGSDVQNVTASVTSSSPNTTIIDGGVNFVDVAAGSTVAGTDTFTIRQNRSYAFDPNSLTWNIQFELAAQIILPEGGEIQGEGGIVLIVPGGATSDPIPVTITVLQENDLGAAPPSNTTFLGGANIDMGQNELMDNADISMPAPDGVPDGAEVYLAKLIEYAGQTMYQMIDTAIVQNGIIVSQDPAFPGVTTSGNFCFLWAQNVGWVGGQVTNINSGIAVPEAVVTISGGYWLDIADDSGYYSLPAWAGNFVVNAFDDQTGDFGEKQGFMPNDGATVLINVEIGESSGPTQSTLINGNFEDGLTGWVLSGAGDVVDSFGPILPYEGSHMAMISSGNGAVGEASSALEQSFTVPEGANKLTIHYNFISEEYPEYVGSQFNDVMNITLHTPDGSKEIAFEEVNSAIFEPVSGIPCGSGDCTWGQTDWLEASIDVSQWAGTDDTLTLTVHDVGDTVYDTVVLLDSINLDVAGATSDITYNNVELDGVKPETNLLELTKGDVADFDGTVYSSVGLKAITVLVSGPIGDQSVLSEDLNGTSIDLSVYSFNTATSSYANKSGTYYVALWVKNNEDKTVEFKWTVDAKNTTGKGIAVAASNMENDSSGLTYYGFDPAYHNEMFKTAIEAYILSSAKPETQRKYDVFLTLTIFSDQNKEIIYDRITTIDPQSIPANGLEAQQILGVRKQCKEWVDSIANDNGGHSITYSGTNVTLSKINAQVGKAIYYTQFSHAAIIISLNRDLNFPYEVTSVQIAESNWADDWEDPTGQIPWERTIGTRTINATFFNNLHIADIDE